MNQEILAVARGEKPAERIFVNGKILDIYNGCWIAKPLAVHQGIIVGFGEYEADRVIDLEGGWMVPGLIDAHMHVESSMLTPERFAELVLPRGTTTIVADPHEIANVCGLDGIDYLLESNQNMMLDLFMMLPSCVPATPFESAGATLLAKELETRMQHPMVLGLGEMMNYPGVILGDPQVHEKLDMAKRHGKILDGHIEPADLNGLNAYVLSGIEANHECTTLEEARLNLQSGMALMIREGTAARNLDALLPVVDDYTRMRCMFCTDDRHPDHIEKEGHIDGLVRQAICQGTDPIMAIRMASLNTALFFGLKDRGAIAPGKKADLLVLEDPQAFEIREVYKSGELIARDGCCLRCSITKPLPATLSKGLDFPSLSAEDLHLELFDWNVVIGLVPHEITTRKILRNRQGAAGAKKIAVIERHHGTGNIGLGLVEGFGFNNAAIASTVAHDSHNLIVVGDNDPDMLLAIQEVKKTGGGLVLASGGKIQASLPLPVAGLLSDKPYEEVKKELEGLREAIKSVGYEEDSDPFMTLAFLALPVIPEIRITDQGLFDVTQFRHISHQGQQD